MRKQILSVNLTAYEIAGSEDHEFLKEPCRLHGTNGRGWRRSGVLHGLGRHASKDWDGRRDPHLTRLGRAKSTAGHSFGGIADE